MVKYTSLFRDNKQRFCKEVDKCDLIENFITPGITQVYAKEKTGKTFFVRDLALAVSNENTNSFLNHQINKHGPVLFFALDDNDLTLSKRFKDIDSAQIQVISFADYKIAGNEINNALLESGKDTLSGVDLFNEIIKEYLVNKPSNLKTPVLIIVDTLEMIRDSKTDRNYQNDVPMVNKLKKFPNSEFAIPLIIINHATKDNSTYHGSTGLGATVDNTIKLSPQINSKIIQLTTIGNSISKETLYFTIDFENNYQCQLEDIGNDTFNDVDPNIMKVINYIITSCANKPFVGTIEELCAKVGITSCVPSMIGKLLMQYRCSLLAESNITFQRTRTSKNRLIKLSYNAPKIDSIEDIWSSKNQEETCNVS